jgi:hypothetical protein
LYGCENTGVAGKGVCKVVKTKGEQKLDLPQRHRGHRERIPARDGTVNCFASRARKKSPYVADSKRGICGGTPTPAFCKKRLEVIENTGRRAKKEGKETQRGGKWLK